MKRGKLKAMWIWARQSDVHGYNQTVEAVKTFRSPAVREAMLRITADTAYRLHINGEWVSNGPARFWPEHAYYDEIDVAAYLRPGLNEIRVIVKYHGAGSFHHVPRQAGLLCQLDLRAAGGKARSIVSDRTWKMRPLPAWRPNTPKISCQKGPVEVYDARLEDRRPFHPAVECFPAAKGPWKDLQPRDMALLTRRPMAPRRILAATVVRRSTDRIVCIPAARLAHPGLIETNQNVSQACVVATHLLLPKARDVQIRATRSVVTIDGQRAKDDRFTLDKGGHFLMITLVQPFDHGKELHITLHDAHDLSLRNPLDPHHDNPWCLALPPESEPVGNDLVWAAHTQLGDLVRRLEAVPDRVTSLATFKTEFAGRLSCPPAGEMLLENPYPFFANRTPIAGAAARLEHAAASMHDNADLARITPHPDGDTELAYDLGQQVCGYYLLDFWSEEDGLIVDVFGIEHITPDGTLQHTGDRNGMRYITRKGRNRFVSFERRSGRYLYLTLRNQTRPVAIRQVGVIEATYPVEYRSAFACSDPRLDRIWEISARTLKLCMEDTFTDCPLFEQTLWVGDARNEALFAYTTFGAQDLARRCLRLCAQSLERYPLVGCQVPSSWDCLLPAWSFLWGIGVWDYYFNTGDMEELRRLWPAVMTNLRNASTMVDARGLFSGQLWNLFDWAGIDDKHRTVLHNSLFAVGAADAALKCAAVLNATGDAVWLRQYRDGLVRAVNACWREDKQAYPDSIHDDGTVSDSVSQHTAFLSVLYDVVPPEHRDRMIALMTDPPADVVKVGSPFAILYLYEALEKAGLDKVILDSVYAAYLPMLDLGATTVWETFAHSPEQLRRFPTRSHCHAWSAAPLYVLPRIVLGIRPVAPAWAACTISPRPFGLTSARGTVVTPQGDLSVAWRIEDGTLHLQVCAPAGIKWTVDRNPALEGLRLVVNGASTL